MKNGKSGADLKRRGFFGRRRECGGCRGGCHLPNIDACCDCRQTFRWRVTLAIRKTNTFAPTTIWRASGALAAIASPLKVLRRFIMLVRKSHHVDGTLCQPRRSVVSVQVARATRQTAAASSKSARGSGSRRCLRSRPVAARRHRQGRSRRRAGSRSKSSSRCTVCTHCSVGCAIDAIVENGVDKARAGV